MAQFTAVRVTPAHDWRQRRLSPEVWLLAERDRGATRGLVAEGDSWFVYPLTDILGLITRCVGRTPIVASRRAGAEWRLRGSHGEGHMPILKDTHSVALPLVDIHTTLGHALTRMRAAKCSGVVATRGKEYWLFRASDLVIGLASGTGETLADLQRAGALSPPQRLARPAPNLLDRVLGATVEPSVPRRGVNPQTGARIEIARRPTGLDATALLRNWLDGRGRRYAVAKVGLRTVRVLTYFKTLRAELESSPKDCYCRVDREPVPNGTQGGNCPDAHTHGAGTVFCVR